MAIDPSRHQVCVVGGGFGGLYATKSLSDERLQVTLVDRRNFHLFQPLLYQAATGWLSPSEIASPLRAVFGRRRKVEVLLGEVVAFDLERRRVRLADGGAIPYDSLIVAAGSETAWFGNEGWRDFARGVKSIEDAIAIRHRLLLAFEAAEREDDPEARRRWLTIVVIGGGTTGVEMAGVIGELARDVLRGEYRRIDPRAARIVLVHSHHQILPEFPEPLAASATRDLERIGVEVRIRSRVVRIDDDGVDVKHGDSTERISSACVIWGAGVRASHLADRLARDAGATTDRGGRVEIGPDLRLPGYPEVFVIGDMAAVRSADGGEPLPGVASVAMQQGRFAATEIRRRLDGVVPPHRFHYQDRGMLATIGRGAAVARIGPLSFDGFLAWVVWALVHLLYLVEFQNRIVVMTRWAWDFFLHERGSRIITGSTRITELRQPWPSGVPVKPAREAAEAPVPAGASAEPVPVRLTMVARRFGHVRFERTVVVSRARRS
jgi:NADH dehydrogenase